MKRKKKQIWYNVIAIYTSETLLKYKRIDSGSVNKKCEIPKIDEENREIGIRNKCGKSDFIIWMSLIWPNAKIIQTDVRKKYCDIKSSKRAQEWNKIDKHEKMSQIKDDDEKKIHLVSFFLSLFFFFTTIYNILIRLG